MPVTLDQLRHRTRVHADLVSSSFVLDDELDGFINASGGDMFDVLQSRYEDWVTTPGHTTFTLVEGENQHPLPADCLKLRGVDRQEGADWVPMRSFSLEQRGQFRSTTATPFFLYGQAERRYRQVGRRLEFMPEASAGGTYRFRYVQSFTPLSASAQPLPEAMTLNGWDEYVVVDAAIKCKQKGDRPTAELERQKATLLRRIESAASNRDASEQEFICDPTTARHDWWR